MEKNKEIFFDGLNFSYLGCDPLFSDMSFTFPTRGFHSLFGPSGVGKSTLSKIICNLQTGWTARAFSIPNKILYCYNKERFPSWKSVGSHFVEVIDKKKTELLNELLDGFKINEEVLRHYPPGLSTGQHNRINLLRYLLQDFDLLIMDEALSNVDEIARIGVLSCIKKFFPEKGFLYVSHQFSEIIAFSDIVMRLSHIGQKVSLDSFNALNLDQYSSKDVSRLTPIIERMIENA